MFKVGKSDKNVYSLLNQAIGIALCFGLYWLLLTILSEATPKSINLVYVALAAFAAGLILGFIFGADSEEQKSLTPIAGVINGLLGGFALADMVKEGSIIVRVLHSIASGCGYAGIGFVSCIIVYFWALGFLGMFTSKRYFLNPAARKLEKLGGSYEKIMELTSGIHISLSEIGVEVDPTLDKEAILAALKIFEEAAQDRELASSIPIDTYKSYAKGYYALAGLDKENKAMHLKKAENVIRLAREKSPDDADLMYFLSYLLLLQNEYNQAVPFLTYLTKTSSVRVLVYKMLGYAYLWNSSELEESAQATTKYLAIYPNDAGAKLNLACAYGQRGPDDPSNRERVLKLLQEAVRISPNLRAVVMPKLIEADGDFYLWKDLPEFQQIFASPAQPVTPVAPVGDGAVASDRQN